MGFLGVVGVFVVPLPNAATAAATRLILVGGQVLVVGVLVVARTVAKTRPRAGIITALATLLVLLVLNVVDGSVASGLIKRVFAVVLGRGLVSLPQRDRRGSGRTDPALFD